MLALLDGVAQRNADRCPHRLVRSAPRTREMHGRLYAPMNEWLAGAEAACNEAVEGGPTADRLLQIAQVHALIAIAQEVAGIRELIVMTETVEPDPDYGPEDEG